MINAVILLITDIIFLVAWLNPYKCVALVNFFRCRLPTYFF